MKENKSEIIFKADGKTECNYCGIMALDHIHRTNTLPRDFERIEPQNDFDHEYIPPHLPEIKEPLSKEKKNKSYYVRIELMEPDDSLPMERANIPFETYEQAKLYFDQLTDAQVQKIKVSGENESTCPCKCHPNHSSFQSCCPCLADEPQNKEEIVTVDIFGHLKVCLCGKCGIEELLQMEGLKVLLYCHNENNEIVPVTTKGLLADQRKGIVEKIRKMKLNKQVIDDIISLIEGNETR